MGKKREEREERGRGHKEGSRKGKTDTKSAENSAAQDAAEVVSPYQKTRFAGKMVVVTRCGSAAGRVIAPGLAMGEAWANPKRENGHRCTACGKDVIPGHVVVRVA